MAKPKNRTAAGGRPTKHPWDEIRALYVEGEAGEDGRYTWPTKQDLATRYKIALSQVSRESAKLDADARNWDQARENFKKVFERQVQEKLASTLAGKEVAFRVATMDGAEKALRQIVDQLGKAQGPDGLTKLATALKKAQEVGMVALDRPADGPGADDQGVSDWTLMRKIRAGEVTV